MYRAVRPIWGLIAIGAATAVGLATRDAGFTVITFIGALAVPRVLGLTGAGRRHGGREWSGGCAGRHARSEASETPAQQVV